MASGSCDARPAPDLARASAPIPGLVRDYAKARPVDDATFRAFVALYDYDHTPLNAKVVARDSSAPDWVREEIEFDVPGDSLRMLALFFLPRRVAPPYQTVVLFPASDALFMSDHRVPSMSYADYYVRSGRAVVYPIYEHTYGRGSTLGDDDPDSTIEHRDQMIRWAREMRRSVDYAVTRPDIDTTRFAFAGTSWGGRTAGVMLALEPRFKRRRAQRARPLDAADAPRGGSRQLPAAHPHPGAHAERPIRQRLSARAVAEAVLPAARHARRR